jgi:hypothetical protein
MENLYLKLRYNLFKKSIKKKDFSTKKLVFSDDFKNLDNFNIKDNEFYNDNDVWFSKDMVNITENGLEISCIKKPGEHTSWNGTRTTTWISGMIDSREKFELSYGTWVFEGFTSDSWPALWLLKKDHYEFFYKTHKIIPEVDIMEVIKGKVCSTVHWGYSDTEYRRKGTGQNIYKQDDKYHQFAVELLPNGYKFYYDGILVSKYKKRNPEFVSNAPSYMLINNAAITDYNKNDEYKFIIKSVKVYK